MKKIKIKISDEAYEHIVAGTEDTKDESEVLQAVKDGYVIPTGICSCYYKYPNPNHKKENGKWKCVDCYENINNAEGYRRKTHCRRKGD